ncbi:MAG: S-layer homology domain-containing protein [Clostridiales bacterium]|jgi:hypothetical protein|nr:S-layer homology domain-containing protein [Clostridiales bacterium]
MKKQIFASILALAMCITIAPATISAAESFNDVQAEAWYAEDAAYVYDNDLMDSTGENPLLFSPEAEITRGAAVYSIYRLAGRPDTSSLANPFDDASYSDAPNSDYTNAVKWAAENKIISGYGNGKFEPESNITRQDFALILYNYVQYANIELVLAKRTDNLVTTTETAEYAKEAITRLYSGVIINERPGIAFDPNGSITRAEVAAMLHSVANFTKA